MPILGSGMHPQSSGAEYSVKPVPFPVWAYGAVSGVVVVWLLIGCLFTVCLRRRKPRHNSCRYCSCCCSGSRSTAKAIKNDGSSLKMSSPIATSETKSSHTITTTTTEAQDYTPSDHHSVRLQLKAARNDEAKRLLKGTEGGSEPITMMPGSSSASTPTNTANSMKGRCLPPTANVPYPSGAGGFQAPTPPSAFNVINSMTGFSPHYSSGGLVVLYETHWNVSQLQTSVSSRNNGLLEVPPYASSNVLPPEVSRSSQNNPIKGL